MKRSRINAVDIVREQFAALQNRFKVTADPWELRLLQKRITNLQRVIQFLSPADPVPKEPDTVFTTR